jgi:hypothetical protein
MQGMTVNVWRGFVVACLAWCGGCAALQAGPPSRERGGGMFETAQRIRAPKVDRCEAHANTTRLAACQDALYLAKSWARDLSPGDGVCLEGGVGEVAGPACLARASVVDVATNSVLLEVREARPDSRFRDAVQQQAWYEEGALVELFLAEQGW